MRTFECSASDEHQDLIDSLTVKDFDMVTEFIRIYEVPTDESWAEIIAKCDADMSGWNIHLLVHHSLYLMKLDHESGRTDHNEMKFAWEQSLAECPLETA